MSEIMILPNREEMVNPRVGLYLMENGIMPFAVKLQGAAPADMFFFAETPELKQALREYQDRAKQIVESELAYDEAEILSEFFNLSPEQALEAITPKGAVRAYFAYVSMDTAQRRAYIEASAEERAAMLTRLYCK